MHRKKNIKRDGFSLLELLAVVTILAIIAAVVIPRISSSKLSAQQEVNKQNIAEINAAVERWYFEKGSYPKVNLNDIASDIQYFPEGIPVNPVTGKKYRLDSKTHRVIK